MKVKILYWNVRGVNDSKKRNVIRNFIRTQRADLVCLQETKIQGMNKALVHGIGVGRFLDWKALDAEGIAKGILLFWDKRKLSPVKVDFQWMFTEVYGPVERSSKEFFWEELGSIRGIWNGP